MTYYAPNFNNTKATYTLQNTKYRGKMKYKDHKTITRRKKNTKLYGLLQFSARTFTQILENYC